MVNHVRPGPSQPAARLRAMLAAWRSDESGSIRTDRFVMGLGVVAVLGLLIINDVRSEDPTPEEAAAAQAAATRTRTISSVGTVAPQPAPMPEGRQRQSHASASYGDRFTSPADNETALLEMQTELAREAEAAAGGPPPVAESVPEAAVAAEATPGADEPAADGS